MRAKFTKWVEPPKGVFRNHAYEIERFQDEHGQYSLIRSDETTLFYRFRHALDSNYDRQADVDRDANLHDDLNHFIAYVNDLGVCPHCENFIA